MDKIFLNIIESGTNGVSIDISSIRDLSSCYLELYIFDFKKGRYNEENKIRQTLNVTANNGKYTFNYDMPPQSKIKCVVTDGENQLAMKEKYIGPRHKIYFSCENAEGMKVYKVKSEAAISRNLISYKINPELSLNLPRDLEENEILMFTVEDSGFALRLEINEDFTKCFTIEE